MFLNLNLFCVPYLNEHFQVEQVSQLVTFTEALYEYHSQCSEILKVLTETLKEKYVVIVFEKMYKELFIGEKKLKNVQKRNLFRKHWRISIP